MDRRRPETLLKLSMRRKRLVSQRIKKTTEKLDSFGQMPLLRVTDVALLLGISPKTIHKLVREGKLACVQITARERRFTHQQVEDYIHSQSTSVRVDRRPPSPVKSALKKGGSKSIGVSGTGLTKEIRSLCRS